MKSCLTTIAACCCLGVVSCVGTKELTIRTQPEGADISINGVLLKGQTPLKLKVSQKKDLGIVASKPGYETAAQTLHTRSNWWLSLLWTKNDPRAQYIEEDEVTINLAKIPTATSYKPSVMPPYTGGGGYTTPPQVPASKAPELRPMPQDLVR